MDTWKVGPVELKSRLILGSGKYKDFGVMREAIAAAKAEVDYLLARVAKGDPRAKV